MTLAVGNRCAEEICEEAAVCLRMGRRCFLQGDILLIDLRVELFRQTFNPPFDDRTRLIEDAFHTVHRQIDQQRFRHGEVFDSVGKFGVKDALEAVISRLYHPDGVFRPRFCFGKSEQFHEFLVSAGVREVHLIDRTQVIEIDKLIVELYIPLIGPLRHDPDHFRIHGRHVQ